MRNPLADLNEVLAGNGGGPTPPLGASPPALVGDFARLDHDRGARTGTPEVIYAPGKTTEQLVAIVDELLARGDRAIVSRINEGQYDALQATFGAQTGSDEGEQAAIVIERRAGCPTAVVRRGTATIAPTGGYVGILTAGTADLPTADEARVMAEAMGCRVSLVCDVGVAGLHRLFEPLGRLLD